MLTNGPVHSLTIACNVFISYFYIHFCGEGPNPATVSDFIQMVWEQGPHVVVMLTRLLENGRVRTDVHVFSVHGALGHSEVFIRSLYMNDQYAIIDNSVAMKYCSKSIPNMHVRMLLYGGNRITYYILLSVVLSQSNCHFLNIIICSPRLQWIDLYIE